LAYSELESWFLVNLDTQEEIQGQFPPVEVTQDVSGTYGESHSLNRQSAITQFLHGNSDTISFQGRLFTEDIFQSISAKLKLLQSWVRRDPDKYRPPVLLFYVGDATLKADQCNLEALSGITYHSFRRDGSPRDVTFTINLREYVPFSLEVVAAGETRYHRARFRDYHEAIAQREYGNPMLGVVVRQQHPNKALLEVGDVVKLLSIDVMRKEKAKPTSIALKTAYGRRDTPQRALRIEVFDQRNIERTSYIT